MSANSHRGGSYSYSRDPFKAFDALPPTARRALAAADFNWAAVPVLTRHKQGLKGYKTGKDIAATVSKWDREQHKKGL